MAQMNAGGKPTIAGLDGIAAWRKFGARILRCIFAPKYESTLERQKRVERINMTTMNMK